MRVSGNPASSDYWRNVVQECPTILLDGKAMEHVVVADEELGVVKVEVWHDGRPLHDGETILTEILQGRVQIIVPSPSRH